MQRRIYFIALAFFSILYVVLSAGYPFFGKVFLKALPIWMVAIHVFLTLKDRKGRLLFIGLLFGSAGDVLIGVNFVIGLGMFLIGHLFYTSSFLHQWKFQAWKLAPVAAVVAITVIVANSLGAAPKVQPLKIPVFAYMGVIMLMVITAIFRSPKSPAVWIGAVFFLLSDAMIAINKFIFPIEHESYLIMGTYYLAQILIGEGSIEDNRRSASQA